VKFIQILIALISLIFPAGVFAEEFDEFICSGSEVLNLSFNKSLSEQYPDPVNSPNWYVRDVEFYEDGVSFSNYYDDGSKDVFDLFYFDTKVLKNGETMTGFECMYASSTSTNNTDTTSSTKIDSSKPHILVELISYEDKKDYEEKPYCEMEFTFTNNSFGTLYQMNIETESFDDRGDKLDDYAFNSKIKAFGDFWSMEEEIKIGNSATSKSLSLKTKCQYVKDIYMTEVKDKYCNIRMLPEEINCLDLVVPNSKIDHINLLFR